MRGREGVKVYAAVTVAHVLWGFSFLASLTAQRTAPLLTLLSHRFLLAFLLLCLLLPFRMGRLSLRGKGKRVLLLVLLGILDPLIYFLGEQYGLIHSTSIFSGVMIALIPLLSTLTAVPILGEKVSMGQLLFGLLSVAGVIGIGLLTGSSGHLDWIGVVCLLTAMVAAAAYTLLSRSLSREFSSFERTFLMMGMGALAFTVLALIRERGDLAAYVAPLAEPSYLLSLLFLGLGCSVVSYLLLSYSISRLPVARESVFANLTTAVSVLAGALLLKEPFSWREGILCAVILLGILGVQWTEKKIPL